MEVTNYYTPKSPVAFIEKAVSLGGIISADLGTDENGRKVVKAGTPVGGQDFKINDQTVLGKATTDNVQGVLFNDVDVTHGNANGTVMIYGFINKNHLDSKVTIDSDVEKALENKITFIKR